MNVTQQKSDVRHLVKEISQIECLLVEAICEDDKWLNHEEENTLRWALSLARVSKVASESGKDINIDHATDRYRESLFNTLKSFCGQDGQVNKKEILRFIKPIGGLCSDERKDLLQLYGSQLSKEALDRAVQSRPLAVSMGGGGGTGFVYLGAFEALQRESIIPDVLAGTSIGSILGAFRARYREFSLEHLKEVMLPVSFDKIAKPFQAKGKYTVPATFRLHLRDVFKEIFRRGNTHLRLRDLEIPFRVSVAGLSHVEGAPDENLEEYAHLLDDQEDRLSLRRHELGIVTKLLEFARRPLKAIYLGGDDLSKEFDVVDAVGFSCAIPGIFHYDVSPDDKRMIELVEALMKRHSVYRFIDGGWVDNLPSIAALNAVQESKNLGHDPFILALDGFSSSSYRQLLFLPVMQMAAQNSKQGKEMAHRTITFEHVLSPLNLVPGEKEFHEVLESGIEETKPHIPFIKKMIGPIDEPQFIKDSI